MAVTLFTTALWAVGGRVPRWLADAAAHIVAYPLALLPLSTVAAWAESIEHATGSPPTLQQRAGLLQTWIRNMAWSLSLAGWSDEEVLRVARISPADHDKLLVSLRGPGLVLALPHMGSWDLAGAWCSRVGIEVVSVAEPLPRGMFERFRDARAAMGMRIYAAGEPDLLGRLTQDIHVGRLVCLLSDRDLSTRGLRVPWPGGGELPVPVGPALLAQRTGADLRVVTTHFDGAHLIMKVSEAIRGEDTRALMTAVVAEFARAVRHRPQQWLMLRRVFR